MLKDPEEEEEAKVTFNQYEEHIRRLDERVHLVLSSLEGAPGVDKEGLDIAQKKIYDGLDRLMALIGK